MRKGLIGLLAVAVIVIAGLYMGFNKQSARDAASVQPAASETTQTTTSDEHVQGIAVEHGKTYALGNPDAPIKIKEFASLSCSHCASFHNETLPQVKKELIETGKVYFEFHHFPLNAPAMDGALISLCLPEERFHQFISFLFEQQSQWAFNQEYRTILKQNAKLLGASEEQLEACLNDENKRADIVAKMQEAGEKYGIRSTPSFVINEKNTISGAFPFKDFKKRIEEASGEKAE